ncbi:MAG TPA: response regulator transcription factor [Polyangiaceae bacterium]|nr:response regulator transcription factor [Polyangiaceae bacterium]
MTIRVLVADDHGVLRSGLRALIGGQPDMDVVGEASNRLEAESAVAETTPDVVIMDLSMPGGGIEAIRSVSKRTPHTRVLVLSAHEEAGYVRAAVAAGATGYVVKTAVDLELLAAIRAVAGGRTFMDLSLEPGVAQDNLFASPTRTAKSAEELDLLTGREREVLELVAEGYTNREVARDLGLSVKSVETYRARLMEKLGLCSRAELVRFALEYGVLRPGKVAR